MSHSPRDFSEDEHMTCPKCGFEVIWVNGKRAAYLYKDATVDRETMTADNEYTIEILVQCNHVNCDWEM